MPFLDVVHVRERRCASCGDRLAQAGARSFIVDSDGLPVAFSQDDPPQTMDVVLTCSSGHANTLNVPGDVSAEATMMTPDDAPIAVDAVLAS
ncbi:MAG: hypothetical protein M3N19_00610 [Candidatus Eremiobacteraeota bacterium]|nr:hypothetical protein [Candidatus Eremiobacteraeota bacterium]